MGEQFGDLGLSGILMVEVCLARIGTRCMAVCLVRVALNVNRVWAAEKRIINLLAPEFHI
jgi:hypothetical protein